MKKFCFAIAFLFTLVGYAQQVIKIDNLTIFLPSQEKNNGTAILCCPGGGYEAICDEHEGKGWAPFFNENGIAWIVVNYDLPNGNPKVPYKSIQKAMKTLYTKADELHIDKSRIGISGFSAGGHLAAMYAVHYKGVYKANFQLLFYPVITMDSTKTHLGSLHHLLGQHPKQKLVEKYSLENQVTSKTPKALLFVSANDEVVPMVNTTSYNQALKGKGVSSECIIFNTGNHGWGCCNADFEYYPQLQKKIKEWLLK